MPQSRKRKSVRKTHQVIPVQGIATARDKATGEPVLIKFKTRQNKVVRHRPTPTK